MNAQAVLDYILLRLSENSTWRGIIGLVTAAGIALEPAQVANITATGLALIALINVFRKTSLPTK